MKKLTLFVVLALVLALAVPAGAAELKLAGSVIGKVEYDHDASSLTGSVRLDLNPSISGIPGVSISMKGFDVTWPLGFNHYSYPSGNNWQDDGWLQFKTRRAYVSIKGAYTTGGQELTTRIGYLGTGSSFKDVYQILGDSSSFRYHGVSVTGAKVLSSNITSYLIWKTQNEKLHYVGIINTPVGSGNLKTRIAYDVENKKPALFLDLTDYDIAPQLTVGGEFRSPFEEDSQTWEVNGVVAVSDSVDVAGLYDSDNNYELKGMYTFNTGSINPTVMAGYKRDKGASHQEKGMIAGVDFELANAWLAADYSQLDDVLFLAIDTSGYKDIDDILEAALDNDYSSLAEDHEGFGKYGAAAVLEVANLTGTRVSTLTIAGQYDLASALALQPNIELIATAAAQTALEDLSAVQPWGRIDATVKNVSLGAGIQNVTLRGLVFFENGELEWGAGARYVAPNEVQFDLTYGLENLLHADDEDLDDRGFVLSASRTITF